MRIFPFLLIASVAAASGPALAQSGSLPGRNLTPPVLSGSWLKTPGIGRHHDFRRHPGNGRGRHGRHHGRFGRGGERFAFGYGGIADVDAFESINAYGTGFFAGGGGEVRVEGGRAHYDYDRDYPYEWASSAAGSPRWVVDHINEPERCTAEHGVRVCRGR